MSARGAGGQRCQLILQRCLAIHLAKPGTAPDDFWMYDSGYLLFQSAGEITKRQTKIAFNKQRRVSFCLAN
ncbi:unnamed protein product [Pieris macdunnoughi]|uniref:Uncharacterized protein n=1 Tax=Pieris macdunnoughi TaxID=345717 RepID=A0A821V8L8_9NEOP|nr:unnamed protein product [Pieris macdunnoughi]